VVVAFGRLIKPHVLAALPMVNMHFSLLPRWRGAAPVERALLAGDAKTGVCLMALEKGLDTGPIYDCTELEIGAEETAVELRTRLERAGTAMLLGALRSRLPEPTPQRGEPTYAAKLEPQDHRLDWSRSAIDVHRVIRVGNAWTTFRGKRLKVRTARLVSETPKTPFGTIDPVTLWVGAGAGGAVELVEVQPEGKPVQLATEWRNGARLTPGELQSVMAAARGPETGCDSLTESLDRMAGLVLTEQTLDAVLQYLLALAKAGVSGVDGASVTLASTDQLQTRHATSDEVATAEKAQ
jgi:methionyl-tRNA formyltransferase